MVWYRQGTQTGGGVDPSMNGEQRASLRVLDHAVKAEQQSPKLHLGLERGRSWKSKKFARPRLSSRNRQFSIGIFAGLSVLVMVCTFFGANHGFAVIRRLQVGEEHRSWDFRSHEGRHELYDSKAESHLAIRRGTGIAGGTTQQSAGKEDDVRIEEEDVIIEKEDLRIEKEDLRIENEELRIEKEDLRIEKEELKVEKEDGERQAKPRKKRRKSGPCEIAFRNTTSGLEVPTDISIFDSFPLNYIQQEKQPQGDSDWKPRFAGHQTVTQREESFVAKNQTLHCGFVKGPEEFPETGFGLRKEDKEYLLTCQIAVSSCIFGNYDRLHTPPGKKVSSSSIEKVCFVMFLDQDSLQGMIEEGEVPDGIMSYGLWRMVLVETLPYSDNRRTGKVPKLLTHRLFPNAKFSIWLDSKLRLMSDPLLILEHFLWRGHLEYAISNHYDRHCVWDEVAQNKKLNKFDHRVIDEQFEFYQKDGLTRFNASDPHKLLPSNVPEGSFIVRAHTPMSNLFSCLWFNEVERFTSRDQLSFAYTYLKFVRMNPSHRFRFRMFKDCERREMTKLYHHKQEEALKH